MPTAESGRMIRQARSFLKASLVSFKEEALLHPVFWIPIQVVPKKQLRNLHLGAPEGIRLLFENGDDIVLALDFTFRGKRMFLSAAHGPGHFLDTFVQSINALEKKCRKEPGVQTVELVYFILFTGPCLMLKSGRTLRFFHFVKGRLREITHTKLEKQVEAILATRKISPN